MVKCDRERIIVLLDVDSQEYLRVCANQFRVFSEFFVQRCYFFLSLLDRQGRKTETPGSGAEETRGSV